jgi:hypothetical protein
MVRTLRKGGITIDEVKTCSEALEIESNSLLGMSTRYIRTG